MLPCRFPTGCFYVKTHDTMRNRTCQHVTMLKLTWTIDPVILVSGKIIIFSVLVSCFYRKGPALRSYRIMFDLVPSDCLWIYTIELMIRSHTGYSVIRLHFGALECKMTQYGRKLDDVTTDHKKVFFRKFVPCTLRQKKV